jgi:hypothetical protein
MSGSDARVRRLIEEYRLAGVVKEWCLDHLTRVHAELARVEAGLPECPWGDLFPPCPACGAEVTSTILQPTERVFLVFQPCMCRALRGDEEFELVRASK